MLSKLYIITCSLFAMLGLAACQRVIDVEIKSNTSLIVIEGKLTNVSGTQTISISKTVPYSDANVYPAITGANVSVNNTTTTYVFKEASPGQYTNSNIRPRPGQTFALNVQYDGKAYSSVSIMPQPVPLDSIGVSLITVGNKSLKTISVYYHDPFGIRNQYRFVMYVNGVQVKQIFTVDDSLTDGRIVNSMLYQDDIELKPGDKVEVEMQCIDVNIFNYWYSISQQGGNGPSNSATPSNPLSNLSNNALGYFSAHTVQRKSITVL